MSQFRVEKRRAEAELTLATGATLHGSFFLAASTPTQVGPERVADLLNAETGFFPFDSVVVPRPERSSSTARTSSPCGCSSRSRKRSSRPDTGRDGAPRRDDACQRHAARGVGARLLSEGTRPVERLGAIRRVFRYLETARHTFIVNTAHVVEWESAGAVVSSIA